jgi:hypothetical protein
VRPTAANSSPTGSAYSALGYRFVGNIGSCAQSAMDLAVARRTAVLHGNRDQVPAR